jgi:hypothetical protein
VTTPITRRTVSAALAALAVTVLAACGTDTASPRAATDPVTVTALSGAPVTVPSGKPTAMFFFSVGCGECVGGAKSLSQAARQLGDTAAFVLVDMDPAEPAQVVTDFQQQTGTDTVPAVIDTDATLTKRYSVAALSTLLVVDPGGAVAYRAADPSADQITAALAKAGDR